MEDVGGPGLQSCEADVGSGRSPLVPFGKELNTGNKTRLKAIRFGSLRLWFASNTARERLRLIGCATYITRLWFL